MLSITWWAVVAASAALNYAFIRSVLHRAFLRWPWMYEVFPGVRGAGAIKAGSVLGSMYHSSIIGTFGLAMYVWMSFETRWGDPYTQTLSGLLYTSPTSPLALAHAWLCGTSLGYFAADGRVMWERRMELLWVYTAHHTLASAVALYAACYGTTRLVLAMAATEVMIPAKGALWFEDLLPDDERATRAAKSVRGAMTLYYSWAWMAVRVALLLSYDYDMFLSHTRRWRWNDSLPSATVSAAMVFLTGFNVIYFFGGGLWKRLVPQENH